MFRFFEKKKKLVPASPGSLWGGYYGVKNSEKVLKEKGEVLGDLLAEKAAPASLDQLQTFFRMAIDDSGTDKEIKSRLSSISEAEWKDVRQEFLFFYLYVIGHMSVQYIEIKKAEYFSDQLRLRAGVAYIFVDGLPQRYSDEPMQLLMKSYNERAVLYDKTRGLLGANKESEDSTLHEFGRYLSMMLLGIEDSTTILTVKTVALKYLLPLEVPQLLTGKP